MPAVLKHTVQPEENGKTVERLLKRHYGISSKLMTTLRFSGRLSLNGVPCRSVDIAHPGDTVCADVSENTAADGIVPTEMPLDILFEDDYILVVSKPGGLEVHPSIGNFSGTLANAVMYYWAQNGEYHKYHIANRLDKDTSGLCVIAKNSYAHSRLSVQLQDKSFGRKYTAIVHGVLRESRGSIEIPIKRDEGSILKRIAAPDGKYAKTNYKTLYTIGNSFSVVEIELETGRTHQIRVHFSHIGHPLVGDWLYGSGDSERQLICRQALHAGTVDFRHPADLAPMHFETVLPDEMMQLIERLKYF